MRNFKQWVLIIICLISFYPISAQENVSFLLPVAPNKDGTKLTYSYTVQAPVQYQTKAKAFQKQIEQYIGQEKLAFTASDGLENLPDVVFILDDSSAASKQLSETAKQKSAFIVCYPVTNASAKKAFKFLKERYYSGQRPVYSTLFTAGEGYHNYRIPSVVATKNGTIIAFTEARAFAKDQAENDIVARRSIDGGKTWSERRIVVDEGKSSLNNIVVIYLENEDRILLVYQCYPPEMREGMAKTDDGDHMRSYSIYSNDCGETWSKPHEITKELCPEGISQFCTGPGNGIEVKYGSHKGRLVIPCNAVTPLWFNYLAYSDDKGETWQITKEHSSYGTNESQVVQTSHNEFLINSRYHIYQNDTSYLAPKGWNPWNMAKVVRNRALTRVILGDNNSQWSATESRKDIPDAACQGSIIRYSGLGDGKKSILLMSNSSSEYSYCKESEYPSKPPMRCNGSVRYSLDEGHTWSAPKRIYGNRFTEYQYSVLVPLANNKVGCIFEANEHIKFAVFDMEWLLK